MQFPEHHQDGLDAGQNALALDAAEQSLPLFDRTDGLDKFPLWEIELAQGEQIITRVETVGEAP